MTTSLPSEGLALIAASHHNQLELCDDLESIADSLPGKLDRANCIDAAQALRPLITNAHALEQDFLFPALAEADRAGIDVAATIGRLKNEQREVEGFADELYDALIAYGNGTDAPNPEAFGYMLRGFFDRIRGRIAYQEDTMLPLLQTAQINRNGTKGAPDQE